MVDMASLSLRGKTVSGGPYSHDLRLAADDASVFDIVAQALYAVSLFFS